MWRVYFLKSSSKDWYYIGSTNDIARRLDEHNNGRVTSTKAHIPLKLMHEVSFENEHDAREFEHRVKKQRLLKEQIVRDIKEHWGIV
jgi:putative endonuclease